MSYKRNRFAAQRPSENPNFKKRECLKCGKQFPSHSVGNRICPSCTHDNQKVAVYTGPRDKAIYIREEGYSEDTD